MSRSSRSSSKASAKSGGDDSNEEWLKTCLSHLSRAKVSPACRLLDERCGGEAGPWGVDCARLLMQATHAIHSSNVASTLLRGPGGLWQRAKSGAARSICGKQYTSGMYCYHCRDCESDRTCAVCVECFEEARHVGHDYRLVRAGGGVCDCGDEVYISIAISNYRS
jgi:hypothetical protein